MPIQPVYPRKDAIFVALLSPKEAQMKMKLAEAQNEWRFVAGNELPPANRIARLLEHAARVRPKQAVPITIVALITFGLEREPKLDSPFIKVVRHQLRSVERRLKARGRALIRCGRGIRASVDEDDIRETLAPRSEARGRAAARRMIEDFIRVDPINISSPEVREKLVAMLRDTPDAILSVEHRVFRDAWIAAAEGRTASVQA